MSNLTLLPSNEIQLLKDKDVAYRNALADHSNKIDFDPKICDTKMLPYLAKTYNIPYWDIDWKEEVKRSLIAEARELHKHAGTPWCLLRILEILGLSEPGENQAIIIEYGNRDQYRYFIRRDGTYNYDSSERHNGGEYIYNFLFTHWSEFGVVIKIPASFTYMRFAMSLINMFKPTHTKLLGIRYGELPTRDGTYRYNSEHTHGDNIIRKGE